MVKGGLPEHDGAFYEWSGLEGYVVLSPAQAYGYYRYLATRKAEAAEEAIP